MPNPPLDAELEVPTTDAGRIVAGLLLLLEVRRAAPELAGNALIPFDAKNPHLVAYQRPGHDDDGRRTLVLCVANVSDHVQVVDPWTLSGLPQHAEDLLGGGTADLREGLTRSQRTPCAGTGRPSRRSGKSRC